MLIEQLDIPLGAGVLDVATGRGAFLFGAAERLGPEEQVAGIDLAPNLISETAAEAEARGLLQA